MNRIVDDQITLIPYYRNDDISLLWYQDSEICKQVDNTDQIYSLTKLHKMYDYLTSHGSCYYIQYKGVLVGDVTLQDNFNTQSQRMFLALGFQIVDEEWYEYKLI